MLMKSRKARVLLAIILIGAFVYAGVQSGGEKSAVAKYDAEGCLPAYDAFLAGRHFVRQALKSPRGAEFSNSAEAQSFYEKTGACTYRAGGYVDAENVFGATTRQHWVADVAYLPDQDSWVVIDLALGE